MAQSLFYMELYVISVLSQTFTHHYAVIWYLVTSECIRGEGLWL